MKRIVPALFGIAILGFFVGSYGSRLVGDPSMSTPSGDEPKDGAAMLLPSRQGSSDTAASLAELPADGLYPRLALWMLDASASDIREFWTAYLNRADKSPALTELIFINWPRIDPEGASAASKGTEFEEVAWAAWAGNDPDRALREVLTLSPGDENKKLISAVVKSLGKSQPTWLREHLEDLPKDWMKNQALQEYSLLTDAENPRESIAFLNKHGWIIPPGTLAAFARESPLDALNFALKLRGEDSSYSYVSQPDDMIAALAEEDPALLDQILPHLRSPEAKMKIQLKQFEALLRSDPEAAEEKALALPTSWAKQDQLALLGNHYLENDPAKALQFADRILSEKGRFGWRAHEIIVDDWRSSAPGAVPPSSLFLDQLLATDPKALMEATLTSSEETSGNYQSVGAAWARRDLPGYADWVSTQKDTGIYNESATAVTNQLLKEGHMEEAMEWAESIPTDDNSKSTLVTKAYRDWLSTAPEAARTWKENATLNEAQLEQINQVERETP